MTAWFQDRNSTCHSSSPCSIRIRSRGGEYKNGRSDTLRGANPAITGYGSRAAPSQRQPSHLCSISAGGLKLCAEVQTTEQWHRRDVPNRLGAIDDARNTVAARDGTDIAAREETGMGLKSGLIVENATIEEKNTETLDEDDDTAGLHDARAVRRVGFNARSNLYLRRTKRSRQSRREEEKAQNLRWKNRSPILGIRAGWQQRAIRLM